MSKHYKNKYLGIDIGGSWIKGTLVDEQYLTQEKSFNISEFQIEKVRSPLHVNAKMDEFVEALKALINLFRISPDELKGIGISTAGIVDYKGTTVLKAASHLKVLTDNQWKNILENELGCGVTVINDSDATTIGLAELGYLTGNRAVGVMPIGTGLGFSVWRNGRRWRPGKNLTLLGSIRTPVGLFDSIASASELSRLEKNNDLSKVFTSPDFKNELDQYIRNLAKVIESAAIIYNLEEVIICGGLADAVTTCDYPLERLLNGCLSEMPVELDHSIRVKVAKEGNRLQLIGAVALTKGESVANASRVPFDYHALDTEIPYNKHLKLESMESFQIIEEMWKAENEAESLLGQSLGVISNITDSIFERIKSGGRIIYVGAGTSGRIAAMDTVEIPCTYGFPEDKIITLVSGGISDAAIEIETNFEEDASSVPEMLLLNIKEKDTVIGISVSGTAYYIQSALAFAKARNALTVMIQAKDTDKIPAFCDFIIPLNSGNEVVAGSTRMKAGTATKKVLNFISSTLMIKMGKVSGPYMTDMACINNKLIDRAKKILFELYNMSEQDAYTRLKKHKFHLKDTINEVKASL